jgi:DNA polymerase III delta subunit
MLTHIDFLKNFSEYKEKNIFILLGPEDYPIKTIIQKFNNYEISLFFGDEINVEKIINYLRSSEIFSKRKKLAIVRDFEEMKNWKQLLKINENKVILYSSLNFYENNLKKLESLAENFIKKNITKIDNCVIVLMPYLNKDEKRKWIIQKLKSLNINLNAYQIEKLVQILPNDLKTCSNEIEKIYLSGEENFDIIISNFEERKIYEFLNYLQNFDFLSSIKLFENTKFIESNAYILRILLNLLYEKESLNEQIKPSFIIKQLKKINQFYSKEDILKLIHQSLLTDRAYKTFHKGNLVILKLLYHIFHLAHLQQNQQNNFPQIPN